MGSITDSHMLVHMVCVPTAVQLADSHALLVYILPLPGPPHSLNFQGAQFAWGWRQHYTQKGPALLRLREPTLAFVLAPLKLIPDDLLVAAVGAVCHASRGGAATRQLLP